MTTAFKSDDRMLGIFKLLNTYNLNMLENIFHIDNTYMYNPYIIFNCVSKYLDNKNETIIMLFLGQMLSFELL